MIMNNLTLLPESIQDFYFCTGIFSWNEMNSTMHFLSKSSFVSHFLHSFIPHKWPSYIVFFFPLTCRYPNNEHENDSVNGQRVDFERVVYASEIGNEEYMENDDLPSNLLRLVE